MVYGRISAPLDPRAPDFWLEEFTKTSTGLPNVPDPRAREQIRLLAVEVLQPVRNMLGPLNVNSGFRTERVNQGTAGSSSTSEHMDGSAADIGNDWFSGKEIATYLWTRTDLPLGEVIWYTNTNHVHVTRDPRNRREFRVGTRGQKHAPAWRPSDAEVRAVLEKVAGGATDAGTRTSGPHPERPYEPPGRLHSADGGGAMGLFAVVAIVGAGAFAAARSRRERKRKGKR